MKPIWRKLLSSLFILGTLTIVIGLAFSNNDLADAWETLFKLDPLWLGAACMCWLCCLLFDGLSCKNFLRRQHYRIPFMRSLFISAIGYFYSNITPGASGGQPMQVYYMSKSGVPVGVATSCVTIKTVCNQFMLVVIGSVLWAFNRDFVNTQLAGVRWLIIIGWIINFMAIPPVLLITFNRPLLQRILAWLVRLGAKLRIIKNVDAVNLRVVTTLDAYHESILRLGRHPWHIVWQMLLSGMSLLGLMSVVLCVYLAFGGSFAAGGVPWYRMLTVSFLLFISTSYTPLPGASGAQEGGFLVFYKGLFPAGTGGLALLVWRFFTYYMFLLVGAVIIVIERIRAGRRRARAEAAKNDASICERTAEK